MPRCPITYDLCGAGKYSIRGLKILSPRLHQLNDLPYGKIQQLELALEYADKLSFSGVQPKLSARLRPKQAGFEIVSKGGTFLLKPPNPSYPHLPENEDLTMKLAALAQITVPIHGMIYAIDGSLVYFIQRFDRGPRSQKFAVEDLSQIADLSRDAKYDASMEKIGALLDKYCTFPILEKRKLFHLTLFSFLVGNEDLHMKNLSLMTEEGVVKLSPAYDLVNSTIATRTQDELALTLNGKRSNLKRIDLVDYFGIERLGIPQEETETILSLLHHSIDSWTRMIALSFLPDQKKKEYIELIKSRAKRLWP